MGVVVSSTLSETLRLCAEEVAEQVNVANLLMEAAEALDRQHEALKKLRPWAANRRLVLIAESAAHTHEGETDAVGNCGPCMAAEGVE